jgi:hypothetical protein
MARIDATVTATDPGGKVQLSINKNPINVPPGQHDIVFQLDDQTTQGPTVFDTGDPVYYAKGNTCPSGGKNCEELNVESCTNTSLTLGDDNSNSIGSIGYQLNFRYGKQKAQLDPIIINS